MIDDAGKIGVFVEDTDLHVMPSVKDRAVEMGRHRQGRTHGLVDKDESSAGNLQPPIWHYLTGFSMPAPPSPSNGAGRAAQGHQHDFGRHAEAERHDAASDAAGDDE